MSGGTTTKHEYILSGSQIVRETVYLNNAEQYTVLYLYDDVGSPIGFRYRTPSYAAGVYDDYFLEKNLQGDIVAIYNTSGSKIVTYTYDAWGNFTVEGTSANTIGTLNPFRYRGYYYDNETNLYYLQSRYYNFAWGRFLNIDGVLGANSDLSTYNSYVYCGNNPIVRVDIGGTSWKEVISGILHIGNSIAVAIGIDTAAIGAFFLDMKPDSNGIYHADFDCWQSKFGYNSFYDYVFDVGTSMTAAEFPFYYDGCGYTIWAWKGDYINLGAGAELGIYRGSFGHRTVDKTLAIRMEMTLSYKDKTIISYAPSTPQWWITGFNPGYLNVNANDLIATFTIYFNSSEMFGAFKKRWRADSRWTFDDSLNKATLRF